jgi:hypothetical protein
MHTTTHEIEGIIKSLKAKYSFGYDEIPVAMLKASESLKIMTNKLILDQNLNGGLKIIPPERHGSGL